MESIKHGDATADHRLTIQGNECARSSPAAAAIAGYRSVQSWPLCVNSRTVGPSRSAFARLEICCLGTRAAIGRFCAKAKLPTWVGRRFVLRPLSREKEMKLDDRAVQEHSRLFPSKLLGAISCAASLRACKSGAKCIFCYFSKTFFPSALTDEVVSRERMVFSG
jgi:hypothetical protein